MKSILVSIAAAIPVFYSVAEPVNTCKGLTKEQLVQRREKFKALNGPIVAKPDSQHGSIGVVNTVAELRGKNIASGLEMFSKRMSPFNIKTIESDKIPTVETAKAMREAAKFDFAVFVVSSDKLPSFITAPEDCWAIVNAKCCQTPDRTSKMIAKAFAYIAGAATSNNGISFLSTTNPEELDGVKTIDFPFDVQQRIEQHLNIYHVTPERRAFYRIACREGWAPAPTNDVQKAIWDKVHAMPKNPMKIEFDPKKGR